MTAPLPPLLNAQDVAARLRVDVRTVQRLAVELGARRIGTKLRFRPEDVLAYEDRQKLQPEASSPIAKKPTPIRPVVKREGINKVTGKPHGYYAELAARSGR